MNNYWLVKRKSNTKIQFRFVTIYIMCCILLALVIGERVYKQAALGGVAAYIPQQVTHPPVLNKAKNPTPVINKPAPKTLTIKGQVISYENTGVDTAQSFIDAHSDSAGTYYGSSFSGTDNCPTHFAGHDFGKFGIIKQLVVGDTVSVTNEAGEEFKYVVTETRSMTVIYKDRSGYTQNQDDANFILNMMNSQSEGIFLQTCASQVENGTFDVFFVIAKPV